MFDRSRGQTLFFDSGYVTTDVNATQGTIYPLIESPCYYVTMQVLVNHFVSPAQQFARVTFQSAEQSLGFSFVPLILNNHNLQPIYFGFPTPTGGIGQLRSMTLEYYGATSFNYTLTNLRVTEWIEESVVGFAYEAINPMQAGTPCTIQWTQPLEIPLAPLVQPSTEPCSSHGCNTATCP